MGFTFKKLTGGAAKPGKAARITLGVLETLQVITAAFFIGYFYTMGMWPWRYLVLITAVAAAALALALALGRVRCGIAVSAVLSVIMILLQCAGCYYIYRTNETLGQITGRAGISSDVTGVYVLNDDPAKSLADAAGYTFGIAKAEDTEDGENALRYFSERMRKEIKPVYYDNYLSLASALLSGEADAIIMDAAFVDVIGEFDGYEDFGEKIRALCVYEVKSGRTPETTAEEETQKAAEKLFDITKDWFNVYISGIDTEGDVSVKSRSDVNIILSVNPESKQILMVFTPRDYYVPLPNSNGVRDKLTHAGLYGVDVSAGALEMLYGIDIRYYARMNFTGFTRIIDVLGGVDVYSEYAFSAKGYYFHQGYNKLTGKSALVFARERHSFASGDSQRGKNQMALVRAVIEKAEHSSLLDNYTGLLDSVKDSVQTNMSADEISKLVKMQFDDGAVWNIATSSVTGRGSSQYTFTVPNARAYVMEPDTASVDRAKKLFSRVRNGRKIKGAQ